MLKTIKHREKRLLTTIGWREWIALPDLDVPWVKAKIDTGARTSALHAFDMEVKSRKQVERVYFSVHPLQRDHKTTVRCSAPIHDERWVKSSVGKREYRPVILTRVRLFEVTWVIELTLTSRDQMGFRMLLGRQAIRGRHVVDPSRSFLGGRQGKKPGKRAIKKRQGAKVK